MVYNSKLQDFITLLKALHLIILWIHYVYTKQYGLKIVFFFFCRVSLDVFSVQANTGPKWKNKAEKAFFRGRDSRQERLDLAAMSLKNPDLIDAKITNYFFFKKDEEKYGKSAKHISFFEFFKVLTEGRITRHC